MKVKLRQHIKLIFQKKDREELVEKDNIILENILSYIRKNDIQNICIYENMQDEVSTINVISELKKINKSLYTPQMVSETEMILIDNQYQVYEKELDLFIVPGRAFTKNGKRLGRGKGYYDRFLSKKIYKKSKKIGICYDFQLIESLKTEQHDVDMDIIITNYSG